MFNNSTCNADIQQQQHSANYVKSHANDLNNYSASQSFFVCPALNGLMNCIVQWKKKIKNQKSNSIEIPKIFFTVVTCKKMQIFFEHEPENYSKLAYSTKVKKKKTICCARENYEKWKSICDNKVFPALLLFFASSVARERNLRTQFTKQTAFFIRRT